MFLGGRTCSCAEIIGSKRPVPFSEARTQPPTPHHLITRLATAQWTCLIRVSGRSYFLQIASSRLHIMLVVWAIDLFVPHSSFVMPLSIL